jgi:DNA end-binding protein Ku
MPRAIWSGSISFGLVNIPVKLHNAVSRKNVSFNQIDGRTGARIKYKRVSADDGEEVPSEALVKGYELPSGQFVLIDEDELAGLDPEAVRTIDIEEFVDLADIDPIFYDSAYYLAPDKATVKPYALLTRAMEESQKVGIARFVMRTKQYLAAIRPQDGHLTLSTMVYADEVNDPYSISELKGVAEVDVSDRELAMAQQLIESLAAEFAPEKFEDTYRIQVLDLIERKAAGEEEVVTVKAAPTADKVVDLMAALEASVAAAKEARKRHPTSHAGDEDEAADTAEAAKPAAAVKKAPARKRKSA